MDVIKQTTPDRAITAGFALMRLVDRRVKLDQAITEQVALVLAEGGSWTTVGVALGVSRQAAQQRYGHLIA